MPVAENTFAAACYDTNTISELRAALDGEADPIDMREWSLSADEWREQVETALAARLADAE